MQLEKFKLQKLSRFDLLDFLEYICYSKLFKRVFI